MEAVGRKPLSVGAIVAAARSLLVQGGVERVAVRDVARALQVSAPALYKHVGGRPDIVDLLTAACLDELTEQVTRARDAAELPGVHGRFVAAALAWHSWAHAHPAEHALVFATPAVAFARPEQGAAHAAGARLGRAFLDLLVPAAASGRLHAVPDDHVPAEVAGQLRRWGTQRGVGLGDGQLWSAVRGFHDLMGLIMAESSGQVGFALTDTGAYMRRRIEGLADDLLEP